MHSYHIPYTQCRRRWKNYLIGDIKSGGWNADEDAQLVEAHRLYGNRWTEIAKHVPGRYGVVGWSLVLID